MPQPTNLAEAVGQLTTEPEYAHLEVPVIASFVTDLLLDHPALVMAEVLRHRSANIQQQLTEHIGELT